MADRGRPNVIVFFTDQQRWDSTGVGGNPLGLTPNLDRMAQHGTHLDHAFTTNPVCAPARAALQTGQYPATTGVYRNGRTLTANRDTLAGCFADAGYRTGYIGKWHLGSAEQVPAEERAGYQYWLASNVLEFSSDEYRTVVYDEDGNPVDLPGYRADGLTDAAIRFCADRVRDRATDPDSAPFLLFCSFIEPHHQNHRDDYPAPVGYAQHYTGRWLPPDLETLGGTAARHIGGYYGQIKRLDECLGRLLDALTSLDLAENTIVVFASDHGSHFKTRNAEYKRSCHDSSIRVPLMLRGPGFDGGGRLSQLVSTVDLAPTLLDACAITVPSTMQGRSFLPLTRGSAAAEAANWPDDVFVQVSESGVGRVLRTHRWKYAVEAPEADGWNDSAADAYTETHLYDLHADPYELDNLVGRADLADLRGQLAGRLVDQIRQVEGADVAINPSQVSGRGRPDPTAAMPPVGAYRFGHQMAARTD